LYKRLDRSAEGAAPPENEVQILRVTFPVARRYLCVRLLRAEKS
jgi:hypothetical protein